MTAPAPKSGAPVQALMGFIQPGFPFAKVHAAFFREEALIFSRIGRGGTDAAGTLRGSLGGWTPAAMIAGALGALVDMFRSEKRVEKTVEAARRLEAGEGAEGDLVLPYASIRRVVVRKPNLFREIKVIVTADAEHRFRLDRQSESDARRIRETFGRFLPGKVAEE